MICRTLLVLLAGVIGSTVSLCPPMWTQFGESCYRYYGTPFSNWEGAEKNCLREDAHLVSIHNQEEYDFVRDYWRGMRDEYQVMDMYPFRTKASKKPFLYIGLNDIQTNGVFQWTDGTPVNFLHWMPNNPSLNQPEEGVMIWDRKIHPSRGGLWNDVPAASRVLKAAFMCKKADV